jgi:CubicO group peptidase (beta-lactamase class C family)
MVRRRETLMAASGLALAAAAPRSSKAEEGQFTRLEGTLKPHLAKFGLPAIAAAVVQNGQVAAAGAAGVRRMGTEIPVTLEDRFHIGSDTKAMTATLAGIEVEAGRLRWDSTMGEMLPELTSAMDAGFRGITLQQLLSHTSGLADSDAFEKLVIDTYSLEYQNLDEMRAWLARKVAPMPLAAPPGKTWAYSNLGYIFVGAVLERINGRTWEELTTARIFDTLGLKTAGFGPQASLGRLDAPLGHYRQPDGTLKPMLAGPHGDNPMLVGPAGTVHLSVLDFATWAGWNAGEGKRGPALIGPDTLRRLHTRVIDIQAPDAKPGTPPTGSYCLGWGIVTLPLSPEPFLFHGGSNVMNLAYAMLQPANDFAMVLMTNAAGKPADDGLKAVAAQLYQEHGPQRQ